ncbi:hypothetical protein EUX98_g324 [Antrodiella citrinella]|uniref:Blue (type 1) copper domain-containing protein n=1 Tax=Antrodiella citrinella TaxID=2447956 RepID=A0A4S4N4E3_9APHY|nr:hypothetical protein EUX98_g324 [Antrodiella citrinella]
MLGSTLFAAALLPLIALANPQDNLPNAQTTSSSSTSASASATVAPSSGVVGASSSTVDVTVAPGGSLSFSPANITASNGTLVRFLFPSSGLMHSVTESEGPSNPCTPLANGFDSGLTVATAFTIMVTDDSTPIYYLCKFPGHCGQQMVGSINAPQTGSGSFDDLSSAAGAIGVNEPQISFTGVATGGVGAVASAPPTTNTATTAASPTGSATSAGSSAASSPTASPTQVRRALYEAPENVATLIRVVTSRLFILISDHTFPTPLNASVASYATSFIRSSTGTQGRNTTKEVLNCLRLLQRVLPVVFEMESECGRFELELLWKEPIEETHVVEEHAQDPQFVIEDDDEDDDVPPETPTLPSPKPAGKMAPSLIARLFSCLVDLLYCCGFTLPSKIQVDHYKINYTIWEKAGGITSVAGVAGKLPYNHLVFKGEDPRAILVGTCFQVLCVLLDFQSGSARDKNTTPGENTSSAPTIRTNAFRYFVAKLHRSSDFDIILRGVFGILEQQMSSINNLLPGSRRSVPYIVETVLCFWKILELNKKFRTYVLESDKAMDTVAYILCYGLYIKDKSEQQGMCRAVSYIVQSLSAEPTFGLKLVSPLKVTVPPKWGTVGNAGDFIINAIYSMIATTSGSLSSLYPAYIITLSNAAPHFKHLNVNSSARLLQLFATFANPTFLLADEGHPRLLFFMLEVFNSMILRNLTDNPNLVYGVIRAHKNFEDLGTFTLASGLREIKRLQAVKEERARNKETLDKGKQKASPGEGEEAHVEKARLLRNENSSLEALRRAESGEALNDFRISTQSETSSVASPPMSPTSLNTPLQENQPLALSEKARGKRRAVRPSAIDIGAALEPLNVTGVGRSGFIPTQEWVTSWQQGLPLDPILLMCSELLPKIQELQSSLGPASAATAINDLLRSASVKECLPQPPPLSPRRFTWTEASIVWLTSLIWGEIYVRGMSPLGVWNTTTVRLFYVKHTQTQQRQITETVSNVVGGLLGRTESSQSVRQRPA